MYPIKIEKFRIECKLKQIILIIQLYSEWWSRITLCIATKKYRDFLRRVAKRDVAFFLLYYQFLLSLNSVGLFEKKIGVSYASCLKWFMAMSVRFQDILWCRARKDFFISILSFNFLLILKKCIGYLWYLKKFCYSHSSIRMISINSNYSNN